MSISPLAQTSGVKRRSSFGALTSNTRSGIALIMAMVILAALMLLGLPFLFSQTAALSGARSFHRAAQVDLATDTAARIGAAIAIAATKDSTAVSTSGSSTMPLGWSGLIADDLTGLWKKLKTPDGKTTLLDITTASPFQAVAPGSVRVDLAGFAASAFPRTRPGTPADTDLHLTSLTITDESGKLDPNSLSPAAWDRLLKAVDIPDWDDSETVHSRTKLASTSPLTYQEYDDFDSIGELARALAQLRWSLPGQRITDLAQLLQADTGHAKDKADNSAPKPATGWKKGYTTIGSSPLPTFGLRRSLTPAELDRLRPYLTLHQPRQGRALALNDNSGTSTRTTTTSAGLAASSGALIDLGTVVKIDKMSGTTNYIAYDLAENRLLATIGSGSHLWLQTGSKSPYLAMADLQSETGNFTLTTNVSTNASNNNMAATDNDAVYLEAPTPLNLNAASATAQAAVNLLAPDTTAPAFNDVVTTLGTTLSDAVPAVPALGKLSAYFPPTTTTPAFPLANANGLNDLTLVSPLAFTLYGAPTVHAEFPPLTLLSSGVFSLDATGTITGPDGHGEISRTRHLVMQAVDQNAPIERRWITQGQMAALVAQRWGSNVTTWPVPVDRLARSTSDGTTFPDDPDSSTAATGTSIRPAVVAGAVQNVTQPASNPIPVDWRASFGASSPTIASAIGKPDLGTAANNAPTLIGGTTGLTTTDLRPDGAHLDKPLAYALSTTAGPLKFSPSELASRHLSLWVKPDTTWSSGIVPILDVRVPSANLNGITQADETTAVSPNLTNRLGLYFDAGQQLLVLVVAPPTIEHTVDIGPFIPWDDPATPDLDERCLGFTAASGDTDHLAPRSLPGCNADGSPSGTLANISAAIRANAIVHLWSTKSSSPFFRAGTAHHLEVLLPSSRPGELGLLVDGIAGRDAWSQTDPAITTFGDHATLPMLRLKNDLAAKITPTGSLQKGGDLKLATLDLDGISIHEKPVTAANILPSRGAVRIGNEFIAYQSVSNNTLNNCMRGQRQDTDARAIAAGNYDSTVRIPEHTAGDAVFPVGYRASFAQRADVSTFPASPTVTAGLFRGGSTLQGSLGSGDPISAGYPQARYRIWCAASTTPDNDAITLSTDQTQLALFANGIPASGGHIPLDNQKGVLAQFPDKGVVTIGGSTTTLPDGSTSKSAQYFFAYDNTEASVASVAELRNVRPLTNAAGWSFTPNTNYGTFARTLPLGGYTYPSTSGKIADRAIFLVSIWTDDATNPQESGRYCQVDDANWSNMLQLADSDGRVEWFWYQAIVTSGNDHFFITSKRGWFMDADISTNQSLGNRGMMRTDFAGRGDVGMNGNGYALSPTHLNPNVSFSAGTQLIPVQTRLASVGHLLSTGDVITVIPHTTLSTTTPKPFQLVVRYAACDGFEDDGKDYGRSFFNDVKGAYIAFTSPLPADFISGIDYDIVCGTAWSPVTDLSPNPASLLFYAMPRLDLWSTGFDMTSGTAKLVVAGLDNATSGPDNALTAQPFTVDMIVGGDAGTFSPNPPLVSQENGPPLKTNYTISWLNADGSLKTEPIGTDLSVLPVTVSTNSFTVNGTDQNGATIYQENNDGVQLFTNGLGLVRIGGEVFAYRRSTNQKATLIARSLLGSAASVHRNGEQAIVLPIGPVAELAGSNGKTGALNNSEWFRLDTSGGNNPAPSEARTADPDSTNQPVETRGSEFAAPYALVCSPDGATSEVIGLFGPIKDRLRYTAANGAPHYYGIEYVTAAWTRGLFNSTKHSWSDGDTSATMLRPIVIGWWPRHAPALPSASATTWSDLTDEAKKAALRSRTYSWVGFPHGLAEARFDPVLFGSTPVATMDVLDTGTSDLFTVDVRALAAGSDWNALGELLSVGDSAITNKNLKAAFEHSQFTNGLAAGGAELRMWWRYKKSPATGTPVEVLRSIAESGNSAPAIGPVRLRCLAPTRVLATEAR